MLEALAADPSKFKGTVVVIRYEGPKVGYARLHCCVVLLFGLASQQTSWAAAWLNPGFI